MKDEDLEILLKKGLRHNASNITVVIPTQTAEKTQSLKPVSGKFFAIPLVSISLAFVILFFVNEVSLSLPEELGGDYSISPLLVAMPLCVALFFALDLLVRPRLR